MDAQQREKKQAQLDEADAALHQLLLGKQAVELKSDGREMKFTPANRGALERYIDRLRSELGMRALKYRGSKTFNA